MEASSSRAAPICSCSSVELAAADADRVEEEAVSGQDGVQPARALGERCEAVVAGGEADAGADRGDVVQVAPGPLELEQDRADAAELGGGHEPERLLAGARVGDAVRHVAGGAGTRDVGEPFVQRLPFRGALEPAVLVEELCVEVEDAVADEMEAKVPRLDDAGVDRSDGELVDVLAADRHPALERWVVVDERPQAARVRRSGFPAGRALRARPSRPRERDRRSRGRLPPRRQRSPGAWSRLDRRAACGRAPRPRSRAGRRSARRRRVPRRPAPGRR